jgi:hypothetical protein
VKVAKVTSARANERDDREPISATAHHEGTKNTKTTKVHVVPGMIFVNFALSATS